MLRWLTAGESHGPALVATLEGLPAHVRVTSGDRVLFEGVAPRTIGVLAATLTERGDPDAIQSAEVKVKP